MTFALRTICLVAMVASASALIIGAPPAPPDETLDCGCMNWRDTFISGAVMAAPSMDLSRMLFLSDMGNVCIGQGKQWCYVSSACDVLNGGVSVNEKVATKFCTAEDERLSDKTMPELIAFANKYDLDIELLLSLSYPSLDAPVEWTTAKAYLTGKSLKKPLSKRLTSKLETLQQSGVPQMLDYHYDPKSDKDHTDSKSTLLKAFVNGTQIYEIRKNEMFFALAALASTSPSGGNLSSTILDNPGKWTMATCVSGC